MGRSKIHKNASARQLAFLARKQESGFKVLRLIIPASIVEDVRAYAVQKTKELDNQMKESF
jgi:hypothetical protein